MPRQHIWLAILILMLAAGAPPSVRAAGFGASAQGAVLGQPLDFAVQLRLDPGETLSPECLSAQVTAGERRIPSDQVRPVLDRHTGGLARIRVQTSQTIDEPVIEVLIEVGCTSRMTRRFVVLADPPLMPFAAPAYAAAPPDVALLAAAAASAPGSAALPAVAAAAGPAPPSVAPAAAAAKPRSASRTVAASEAPSRRAQAARRATGPKRAERAAARTQGAAVATARPRKTAVVAPEAPAAGPRLKLEAVAPEASVAASTVELALAAVSQAASSAREAASAASAAAQRIATLERTVDQLRGEARTRDDELGQLRARLAQREAGSPWQGLLILLALMSGALAAWLAWRLVRLQNQRQQGWQLGHAAPAAPRSGEDGTPSKPETAPIPFVTSELQVPLRPPVRPRTAPAWPPVAPPDSRLQAEPPPGAGEAPPGLPQDDRIGSPLWAAAAPAAVDRDLPSEQTLVLPPGTATTASGAEGAARDVSIEELIDLEQQADFFIVLGQDDAAIELLAEHLRKSGGASPLPYLKLLEIHRRRGDRAAYERMRTRFNHRFNAYAPEWGVDLGHGRSLEDYAGILPRLQQAWPRPMDAMAELEALLFRKSRGELFDLPAYREVLFLYSLARDHLDRDVNYTGGVDVLLPLADAGDMGATTVLPQVPFPHADPPFETFDFDQKSTSPVDLDLSLAEGPGSLFGELSAPSDKPTRAPG